VDHRLQQLTKWLEKQLKNQIELIPIVGDASFRRYFRIKDNDQYIVMDSPPELEDFHPYIHITRAFRKLGLNTPEVFLAEEKQGFLLISNFGTKLYHYELNASNVDHYYQLALDDLIIIQSCQGIENWPLPVFGWEAMHKELNFFTEWFLDKYLHLAITPDLLQLLNDTYNILLTSAVNQPQVCVHRDYHSRNLMMLPDNKVGILDFQDAVIGPITYDLVSLIRDCYIDWPVAQVECWALIFYKMLQSSSQLKSISKEEYLRWFDLMGLQRHLKAIFIFARKELRDNNDFYLQFISRALNYVKQISAKYPELNVFNEFLLTKIFPAWEKKKVFA